VEYHRLRPPTENKNVKTLPISGLCLAFLVGTAASAQTNLTRTEVTNLKAKIVAVQTAMGGPPAGYIQDGEPEYGLPTEANPSRGGKFWPITSGVTLNYTDAGAAAAEDNLEKATAEFQAKYVAAIASNNVAEIQRMTQEMTRLQAGLMTPATRKEPMSVYVQLNQNPSVGIDPDAVVLERSGVMVLRDASGDEGEGNVTVYIDPVALRATEELSKVELRTADDGMPLKTGVYHVVITLSGTLADAEAWAQSFDFDAMLGVIDAR
jgi:hypothetical protein